VAVAEQTDDVGQTPSAVTPLNTNAYLDALFNATPDAVIALDTMYRVRDLNAAAVEELSYSAQDAVGHTCMEVLRCQNLNSIVLCGTSSCPLTRVLQKQQPLNNEELILGTQRNATREYSASVTPVTSTDESYVVFTARDVSSLKVANQVRSNFVSMVSHELRTPLNSVHGFIDLLLHNHMGALTPEQRTYLGYTQEGVQQLISIVEDILFMTRSDLGQFEIKQHEVPLRPLIRQVVASLQPQARKAEVAVMQDLPATFPSLYIDPQRIIQVLNNLITNAIKFTPPGGEIQVHARLNENSQAIISVTDSGFGIPPEDQLHIFERFYQSNHAQQSKMGGYGLGLSIAKLIVEQHGGTIGFATALNEGTTFYFSVPLYHGQ
jgi:two-component system phosphate regulon sensor histidine kinase PhoR